MAWADVRFGCQPVPRILEVSRRTTGTSPRQPTRPPVCAKVTAAGSNPKARHAARPMSSTLKASSVDTL